MSKPVHKVCMLGSLLALAILVFPTGVALGRITPPQIDELVASADLIVIGKVTSVEATPAEVQRRVLVWGIFGCAVPVVGFRLWRKGWLDAVCVAVSCLILGFVVDNHSYGTDRRVACVQVASTIRGTPAPDGVRVYYGNGFVCDITSFDAGKEYLLFLKESPSGYRLSWYHWGQWKVENGAIETDRSLWGKTPSVPLAEVLEKIELANR